MKLPRTTGLTVAVDTEGSGLFVDDGARPSAVSCAWRDGDGKLVSIAVPFDQGLQDLPCGDKTLIASHRKRVAKWDEADLYAPNRPPEVWDFLIGWLSRQRLIFHHAKHDCHQIATGLRWLDDPHHRHESAPGRGVDLMPAMLWDTMLAQMVIAPQESAGLKETAVRLHLGKSLGLAEGQEAQAERDLEPWTGPGTDPRYDLIPWRVLGPYADLDARYTLLLFEWQTRGLENSADADRLRKLISRKIRLTRVLYSMEERGVGFDIGLCRQQDEKLAGMVKEAALLVPFKGGTGQPTAPAAQKWFFGAPKDGGLGHLPYNDKMTAGGKPQVDEEVIERLAKDGIPGAKEYQAYAELKAAREKWYSAWPKLTGPDGRLRTSFSQVTVVSGRLSVKRWQAQALPHDYQIPPGIVPIRRTLCSRPGYEQWEVDVSQAEIRVATALAKCDPMLRAIRQGVDSHDAACKLMFYSDLRLAEAKLSNGWGRHRDVAKRCNLGILYGAGAGAIRTAILKFTSMSYSMDQVREWIYDWRQAFPPFVNALEAEQDLAIRQGYTRLVDGSMRYFSDWEPVHKAFNQKIQGNVAVAMEFAMLEFDARWPGLLILQIHDSLVIEAPKDVAQQAAADLAEILVHTFERLFSPVPFKVDTKRFGADLYEAA